MAYVVREKHPKLDAGSSLALAGGLFHACTYTYLRFSSHRSEAIRHPGGYGHDCEMAVQG